KSRLINMDIKKLSETIAKALSESPEFMALFQPQNGAAKPAPKKRLTKEERLRNVKRMLTAESLRRGSKTK
ncbi:MAG: hypothetical protein JWM28_2740, partial [Chitinophagaceae bacterium]|nr:hypothetical protein [Chitinophagaceae bacterium]